MLYDEKLPAPHIPPAMNAETSKRGGSKRSALDLSGVLKNAGDKGFWAGW
jgi:hypothetical protein